MLFSFDFPKHAAVGPVRYKGLSLAVVLLALLWSGNSTRAATLTNEQSPPAQAIDVDTVVLAVRPPALSEAESVRLQRLAAALRESLRARQWRVWSAEATKAWLRQPDLSPQFSLDHLQKRIRHADKTLAPGNPERAIRHLQATLSDLSKVNSPDAAYLELEQSTRIRAAQLCLAFDLCDTRAETAPDLRTSFLEQALFAQPRLVFPVLEFSPRIRQELENVRSTDNKGDVVDIRVTPSRLIPQVHREGLPLDSSDTPEQISFPAGLTRLGFRDDAGWWHQGRWVLRRGSLELQPGPWLQHRLWKDGPGLMQRSLNPGRKVSMGPFRNLFPHQRLLLIEIAASAADRQVNVMFIAAPTDGHQVKPNALRANHDEALSPVMISQQWARDANPEQVAASLANKLGSALASARSDATVGTADEGPNESLLLGSLLGIAIGGAAVAAAIGVTWYSSRP